MNDAYEKTNVIAPAWTADEISKQILPCILDIGGALMAAGADVNHAERLIVQLGHTYGADEMNVFIITGSIVVTMRFSDGREYTQTRRLKTSDIDFYKLELLNKLCRSCKHKPLPPDEFQARFSEIDAEKKLTSWNYAGAIFYVAGYTVFFGGTFAETIVSAILAVILCFLVQKLSQKTPNLIGFNVIATFIIGILVAAACKFTTFLTPDAITSGVIMIIVPGLALTNAIRDMLSGDTLAGLLRFCESLLWTVAMVFGFLVAFMLLGLTVHTNTTIASWEVKYAAILPATLGTLLYYNSRRALMIYGFIGALITFPVYIFFETSVACNEFASVCAASIVAAIFSEIVAKRKHVPTAVFFFAAVMPLIPGRLLFSTVNYLVQGELQLATSVGSTVALTVLGISTAICIVWTISRTWQNFRINEKIESIIH